MEISFGKLKSRFRILRKVIDAEISVSPKIVTACCILHNICEKNRIPLPPLEHDVEAEDRHAFPQPNQGLNNEIDDRAGDRVRLTIQEHLADNFPLLKSFHL